MAESSGERSEMNIGILTVSDSCHAGKAEDKSGNNLRNLIEGKKILPGIVNFRAVVPDEADQIKDILLEWSDDFSLDLILTTGGTGFSPRDVTPEATRAVLEKEAPGLMVAMMKGSLDITPMAMLSRPTCGIRKKTLIINLPGSRKGAQECFEFVLPALTHAVELIHDKKKQIKQTHFIVQEEGHGHGHHRHHHGEHHHHKAQQTVASHTRTSQPPNVRKTTHQSVANSEDAPLLLEVMSMMENRAMDTSKQLVSTDGGRQGSMSVSQNTNTENKRAGRRLSMTQSQPVGGDTVVMQEDTSVDNTDVLSRDESTSPDLQSDSGQKHGHVSNSEVVDVRDQSMHIYDFDEPREEPDGDYEVAPPKRRRTKRNRNDREDLVLQPKMHKKSGGEGEVVFVNTGKDLKEFLFCHPLLKGIYLNRGKRDVKRGLVVLKRQENAIDKGSWQRGSHVHERNRFDDFFLPSEEGKKRVQLIHNRKIRDEYAVNWYLWCPGHGNCYRKCGGYGKCVDGCKGMAHKQDRHNCAILINLKLFLSDLSKWRVQITGNHVPVDSPVMWQPPAVEKQRIDEDTRDFIVSLSQKANSSQIQDLLIRKCKPKVGSGNITPSRKRISCLVSSMKKRRKEKRYDVDKNTGEESDENKVVKVEGAESSGECMGLQQKLHVGNHAQGHIQDASQRNVTQQATALADDAGGEILIMQSEPEPVGLVTLYQIVDNGENILHVQSVETEDSGTAQHPGMATLGHASQEGNITSVLEPAVGGTTVSAASMEVVNQVVEVAQGVDSQGVSNLGDIGALLLAACQQQPPACQ